MFSCAIQVTRSVCIYIHSIMYKFIFSVVVFIILCKFYMSTNVWVRLLCEYNRSRHQINLTIAIRNAMSYTSKVMLLLLLAYIYHLIISKLNTKRLTIGKVCLIKCQSVYIYTVTRTLMTVELHAQASLTKLVFEQLRLFQRVA